MSDIQRPQRNPAMPADWAQAAVMNTLQKLHQLVTTPKRAMDQGITTEEAIPWAADVAMTGAGMGAPAAGTGNVGVFGGRGALTADLDALSRAKRMAERGVDPTDIWQKSGWFKGTDGKWRFEISDAQSSIDPNIADKVGIATMQDILAHSKLYKAYPEVADILTYVNNYSRGGSHSLKSNIGGGGEGIVLGTSKGLEDARETVLHELQHAIQVREGFAYGGNAEAFLPIAREANKRFEGSAPPEQLAYETYRRLAGEVEARNVQARRDFPDREAGWMDPPPPWRTEDVLPHQQIVPYWDKE